jgi:tRNA dimethylallyltransferase
MQVYRGMDIGTAKASPEERADVPHHLLDVVDPDEEFSVARFQSEAARALAAIEERGHRALLVGGTGLYLRAVVDGLTVPGRWPLVRAQLESETDTPALHRRLAVLDPLAATRMEPSNRRRVVRALEVTLGSGRPFSSFGPGLTAYPPSAFDVRALAVDPSALRGRIDARLRRQMAGGFLDEVAALRARPGGLSRTARQALGYRELLRHLDGDLELHDALEETRRRTRAFARRQRAWFRRDPRITWMPVPDGPDTALAPLLRDWS